MNDIYKYLLENLRIAITDDHDLVLEGFKSFLEKKNIRHVETFTTAQQLINTLTSRDFDIYIIDIGMPDIDGFTLIDIVREHKPDAKIIVNTIHQEVWIIKRMLDKKVNAILSKSTDFSKITEAIEAVINGKQYFCPEVRKKLNRHRLTLDHPSEREIEVLRAMARGWTSKEIAAHLFISENTVETHRKKLFLKLNARNIADLIVKAIARGYINASEFDKNPEA